MKYDFLFPTAFKKIGWGLFAIFFVLNVLWMTTDLAIGGDWEDEICMVGMILSLLLISFAREQDEDEYTINLRMKSFAWAFKVFGILVIITTLTVYGTPYLYAMILFLYLIFLLFIGRFYYELRHFRKTTANEE